MVTQEYSQVQSALQTLDKMFAKLSGPISDEGLKDWIRRGADSLSYLKTAMKEDTFWNTVLESAPGFIIVADTDGKILNINQVVPGIEKEKVIGHTIYDFIPREYHQLMKNNIKYVLATGKSATFRTKGSGPDNRVVWYQSYVGPLYSQGRINGITFIANEINEEESPEGGVAVGSAGSNQASR